MTETEERTNVMPTKNEVEQYALLSDVALMKHKLLMARGVLPKPGAGPQGAFDGLSTELKTILKRTSPAYKRQLKKEILLALDDGEPNYTTPEAASAHDDEEYDSAKVQELLQFLTDRLDEDSHAEAMDKLDAAFPGCLGKMNGEGAQDDPLPFPGRPETGGTMTKMAGDSALRARLRAASDSDYLARFPEARHIKHDPTPRREI
jgi:hypothetical protein